MEIKTKIILGVVAAILIIAVGFLFWRWAHAPRRRIIVQKRAVVKEVARKKELPKIQKKYANPKVAIVMDDFGYNMNNLGELFASGEPITFSVLPDLPYSRRVAELARSKGYEVILHLPLESNDKSAPTEAGTIKTTMGEKEAVSLLDKNVKSVPGISGVSNHQGSRATEDKALMTVILKDLKKKNLFFFDSLVTYRSVCRKIASSLNVRYAKRDIFLDNINTADYIEKQILSLRRFAFRKGVAIAICHDRKITITVLSKMMPELSEDGIVFVSLSDMVK